MTFRQRGNAQAGYKGYNYESGRRVTQTDPPKGRYLRRATKDFNVASLRLAAQTLQ
jgi:hypothetical protein